MGEFARELPHSFPRQQLYRGRNEQLVFQNNPENVARGIGNFVVVDRAPR
jgi:hypothetical protein